MLRIFVALPLPTEAVPELANVQAQVRELSARGRTRLRLAPIKQFHLTLAFLGNVQQELLGSVFNVAAATASSSPTFTLLPRALIALPNVNRARVIAISFEEPSGQLASIVAELCEGLRECGCALESRPFVAHVTVARLSFPQRTPEFPARLLHEISPVPVREVAVFQSILKPTGAEYHLLFSQHLGRPHSVR